MRWQLNQMCKLSEAHPEVAEDALQALWAQRPELLGRVVIGAYLDQQVSLSKAAELMGLTRVELQRQLVQEGIPMRTLSDDDIQVEAEAIRQRPHHSWLATYHFVPELTPEQRYRYRIELPERADDTRHHGRLRT